jgi:hypothetical protein
MLPTTVLGAGETTSAFPQPPATSASAAIKARRRTAAESIPPSDFVIVAIWVLSPISAAVPSES